MFRWHLFEEIISYLGCVYSWHGKLHSMPHPCSDDVISDTMSLVLPKHPRRTRRLSSFVPKIVTWSVFRPFIVYFMSEQVFSRREAFLLTFINHHNSLACYCCYCTWVPFSSLQYSRRMSLCHSLAPKIGNIPEHGLRRGDACPNFILRKNKLVPIWSSRSIAKSTGITMIFFEKWTNSFFVLVCTRRDECSRGHKKNHSSISNYCTRPTGLVSM